MLDLQCRYPETLSEEQKFTSAKLAACTIREKGNSLDCRMFCLQGFNDFSGGYNGCEYPSANCEQCDLFIYLALRQHVLCTKVHMSSWSDNSNNIVNKWNKVNSKYLL